MTGDEITQPLHPLRCPQCQLVTDAHKPFCPRCKLDLRYGSPTRIKSGKCIYCEKYRRFSEEHIFGKWLKKYYLSQHKRTKHTLLRPQRLAFWEKVPVHTESIDAMATPYDTVVLNVCVECNNGWMSKLQDNAKPLIKALADGSWPTFSDAERDLIARWSLMVSINLECHGRMLHTTQRQRTALKNGSVPPGSRVSIARMHDSTCAGESFYRSVAVPIGIEQGEFLKIQSTYFCVERVAFHTLTSLDDRILETGMMSAGVVAARLPRLIWPVQESSLETMHIRLRRDDLENVQRLLGPV